MFFCLEARDPRRFLNNRPTLMRLAAQQLSNALLANNSVGVRIEARAHQHIMDIAQAAQLSVQEIFAFSCAEQPPGNNDLAILSMVSLKFSATNFQDDIAFTRRRSIFGCGARSFFRLGRAISAGFRRFFQDLARLQLGRNFFGLFGGLGSHSRFIPIAFDHLRSMVNAGWLIYLWIDQDKRNLGHACRLPLPRTREDNIFHLDATQILSRLFTQHPADGVGDVGFAAPVRAYNRGKAVAVEQYFRAIAKGLEAENMNALKFEQSAPLGTALRQRKISLPMA